MAQSDSGDESLEARFYDHLRASGTTTDNEYAGAPSLADEMEVSPDELQPILERGVADRRLAAKWQRGVKLYSLTTPRYLAEKAEAAERANAVINEFIGQDEPETRKAGTRKPGKPGKEKAPRLTWRYAPVPLAIVNDRGLSPIAVWIAALIAARINLGKWNADLHADISAADLAEWTGSSRSTTMRAIAELRDAGHITTESRGRGGIRFWYVEPG